MPREMPTEAEAATVSRQETGSEHRLTFTAEEVKLIQALRAEGCEVASGGSSLFITALNFEIVRDIFLLHGMSFSTRSSSGEHPNSRLLWTTKGIEFFGKPFYISKSIHLDCINGKRTWPLRAQGSYPAAYASSLNDAGSCSIFSRQVDAVDEEILEAIGTIQGNPSQVCQPLGKKKKKKKTDFSEVDQSCGKKTRNRLQPSKKLDCPALMRITELTVYPEYEEVFEEVEIEDSPMIIGTSPIIKEKHLCPNDPLVVPDAPNGTRSQEENMWASMGRRLMSLNPKTRAIAMRLIDDTLICAESGTLDDSWYITPPIVFNITSPDSDGER